VADTLSQAFIPKVHSCQFAHTLEEINHASLLALPSAQVQKIKQASADDPVLKELCSMIPAGWPERKSRVSESILPGYDIRDELTIQDSLVFKGLSKGLCS